MALKRNQRKVSRLEVFQTFQDSYRANDALRVEGLQSLLNIRKKKAKLQERDKQRVADKYGPKAEQLEKLENKQTANLNFIRGLGMELNRAKITPDKVDAANWVVKGRVYDRLGEPVVNARVALYGIDERPVPKIKEGSTDVNGNYKITVKAKQKDIAELASNQELLGLLRGTRIEDAKKRDAGEAINTNVNIQKKASVFVRASFGQTEPVCADSTPMVARPGVCHYRDIILNFDQYAGYKPSIEKDIRSTRFLGNSATRELHDLQNEKNACRINQMRFDHIVNFKTIKVAQEIGYDFCAYCFGRDKSKR